MPTTKEIKIKSLRQLLLHSGTAVRLVNLVTLYRIVTFPLLIFVLVIGHLGFFKWMLLLSFFTDSIDGYLARTYNAKSILGARLDSLGDDLTVLAAVIGLFVIELDFIQEQLPLFLILLILFIVQLVSSLLRYKKPTSFHTYLAKVAAVGQALFFLSVFFLEEIFYPLFYLAYSITALQLVEEIIMVFVLTQWRANIKGLYWLLKKEHHRNT